MAQWLAWAYKPVNKNISNSSPIVCNESLSSPTIRQLTPDEMAKLQAENSKLREAVQQMTKQLQVSTGQTGETVVGSSENKVKWAKLDGLKGFVVNTTEGNNNSKSSNSSLLDEEQINSVKSFYSKLRQELQETNNTIGNNNSTAANINPINTIPIENNSVQLTPGSAENPIHTQNKQAVVISSISSESAEADDFSVSEEGNLNEEIAVVDLNDVEWWTIVNPVDENGNEIKKTVSNEAKVPSENDSENEDGFIEVKDNDYVDALADFITKHIQRQYPEAARLPPKQLRKMLDGTFSELKEPGTIGKAWQWGKFMYTTYGWGQTAWNLYKEPAVIRLVASGVFQAATWILILIL